MQSVCYSPEGERPRCTGVPAASFGLSSFADYVERSNSEVAAFGLVEDKICVDNIDTVLGGGLVDCVLPGPGDLSVSYGVHGRFAHPLVQQAIKTVIGGARRAGIAAGLYISDPSEVAALRSAAGRMREQVR